MYIHKVIFIGLLTCALLSFAACNQHNADNTTKKDKNCLSKDIIDNLKLVKLTKETVQKSITLTGDVSYNTDNVVPIVSLLDGVVLNTFVSLGQYVNKGQILAEVSSTGLNDIISQKNALLSQKNVADRNLASIKSMFNDGISSQQELTAALASVQQINTSLQQIDRNLKIYNVNKSGTIFQIKAPRNGYVVAKSINTGMNISSNDSDLFTISDIKEVWVMLNIYPTDMQYIKLGMPVKIKTLAYDDRYFEGQISNISQTFDDQNRVLKARVVLPNADLALKPGMSADVIVNTSRSQEQRVAVSNDAIIFDNNNYYVLVYKDACHIEKILLNVVSKNDQFSYVDNDALEGENMITQNQLLIFEQLKGL